MDRLLEQIRASQFLRHNAVFFAGSLVVGALNYLYYPVMGRIVGPAVFGEVQTLVSLFMQAAIFLMILGNVTIHVTVNTDDPAERAETLLGLEYVAWLIGGGVLLVALAAAPFLRSYLHFAEVWPFIATIVGLGFSIPLMFRMAYLRGRKQFIRASATDAIGSAAKLVLSPALAAAGLKSFGALSGIALSQIVAGIFGVTWARRAGLHVWPRHPRRVSLKKLLPQLRHAGALLMASLCIITLQTVGVIAVKRYFSAEQAGYYAGIATVASIVFFVTAPFAGVLISMVSLRQPMRRNILQLGGSLALILALGGATLLVMLLIPRQLVSILIGGQYVVLVQYLPLLAVTMLMLTLTNTLLMYNMALKRYGHCLTAAAGLVGVLVLTAFNHADIRNIVMNILWTTAALLAVLLVQTLASSHATKEVVYER